MQRFSNMRLSTLCIAFGLTAWATACTKSAEEEQVVDEAQPVAEAAEKPKEEPKPPPPPERRFLMVEGAVTLDGQPAEAGTEIGDTGHIKVPKDGRAVITLQPESVVELRPNTDVKVGKSERKEKSMALALGALWSIMPAGASYEVTTGNVVAGVRGTTFFVDANKKPATYVCACEGEVEVQPLGKKQPKPTVLKAEKPHKGAMIKSRGKPKKRVGKAKMHGHTVEQLEGLQDLLEKTKVDGGGGAAEAPPAAAPEGGEGEGAEKPAAE